MPFFRPKNSNQIALQGLGKQIARLENDLAATENELDAIHRAIEEIVSRDYEDEMIYLAKDIEFLENDLFSDITSPLQDTLKKHKEKLSELQIESEESEPKLQQLEKKLLRTEEKKESLEHDLSTLKPSLRR